MKRVLACFMAACLLFLLAACNDGASSLAYSEASNIKTIPAPEPELEVERPPVDNIINPLTGGARPAGMADGQRPVAVMVANNDGARPQRGLAAADIVVEMVTEGGVTRLMALYANVDDVPTVGPVRSTRDAYVQLAVPQDALLVHIGSSVYADNLLNLLEYPTVDGIYLGGTAFGFDEERSNFTPNEYCWYTEGSLIRAGMNSIELSPTGTVHPLFYFEENAYKADSAAETINVVYSDVSSTGFVLDGETGLYTKYIAGAPHADEDGTPLQYTNVLLLSCGMGTKPDGRLAEFDLTGGTGWYFTSGGVQAIRWEKGDPTMPLLLFDEAGGPLAVEVGTSYIGLVPQNREDAVWYGPLPETEADPAVPVDSVSVALPEEQPQAPAGEEMG